MDDTSHTQREPMRWYDYLILGGVIAANLFILGAVGQFFARLFW